MTLFDAVEVARIRNLSILLSGAEEPVRVLRSVGWPLSVRERFFARNAGSLPEVEYASFDPDPTLRTLARVRDGIRDSGVVDDIVFGFPSEASARRKRRWLRRAQVEMVVIDRIVAAVDADIRSRGLIDGDLREMIAETIPGWLGYTRRVVEEADVVSSELACSVLVCSAIGLRDPPLEMFVLGDDSDRLVARARRELVDRLQVIYTHCGERLVDRLETEAGEPDADDLADRMSFVVARSHFADA